VIEGSSTGNVTATHCSSPSTSTKPTAETEAVDGPKRTGTAEINVRPTNATQGRSHRTFTLLSWINANCYQPFEQSFKGQFAAEALQVSVSVFPVMMYSLIRNPYIPCQDLPESVFIELRKPKKVRKRSWRQKLLSVEALCVLTLATTVFLAGFNDNAAGNNAHQHGSRSNSSSHGAHRRYTSSKKL